VKRALAMFTVLPVPASWHQPATRENSQRLLVWLPLVGALLGALAGLPVAAILGLRGSAGLLAVIVGVAALALLTRGLHLDGLADTADGLGSRAEPARALEIMRRSDIGPFGVVTIVLVLLVDVAALSVLSGRTWAPLAALAVAAATGRLAVLHAGLPGVGPARGSGFGALVAGSVRPVTATLETAAVLGFGALLAASAHAHVLGWPVAQAVALLLGWGLRVHASRRLGGVTGDVFGALIEITTALTLVGLVLSG
jgi:adenosylcobinamide-GDP ribazoletransferase